MKKIFILIIIALFIGLAFIPSFNAVSISKDIEKTNSIIDDIEKDCNCQSNGKTHLAEKLLSRLEKNEIFTNIIKSDYPPFDRQICNLLWDIESRLADFAYSLNETRKSLPEDSILRDIIWLNLYIIYGNVICIELAAYILKCW